MCKAIQFYQAIHCLYQKVMLNWSTPSKRKTCIHFYQPQLVLFLHLTAQLYGMLSLWQHSYHPTMQTWSEEYLNDLECHWSLCTMDHAHSVRHTWLNEAATWVFLHSQDAKGKCTTSYRVNVQQLAPWVDKECSNSTGMLTPETCTHQNCNHVTWKAG